MTESDSVRRGSVLSFPRGFPGVSPAKAARKRVTRTAHLHPGVWLQRPDTSHPEWRARYVDASSKKRTVKLEPIDAKTADTRLAWARRLSEQLQRERSDVKAGLVRAGEDLPLADGVKRFFEANPRLSEGTKRSYTTSFNTLVVGRDRLTTRQITTTVLTMWRTECVTARRRNTKRGGRRGEKGDAENLRSPHSANKDMRNVGRLLEFWRSAGMLRLTRDDITACLRKERAPFERRSFLRAEEIRALFDACAAHDAKHSRPDPRRASEAPRFTAITPLVRFLLLTGMRISEALAIEWSTVTEDKIHVPAAISKTKQPRDIDLGVSPSALPSPRAEGRLFNLTEGEVRAARKRLAELGAPDWSPHALRRTCGTFLTCAPSIYGAASAFMSAHRLGHSVAIATRHYVGMVKVQAEAKTLEAAMGLAP